MTPDSDHPAPKGDAMPSAQARIRTDRATRYLSQLCRHTSEMGQMRHRLPTRHRDDRQPPEVQHVDYSDATGSIRFTGGTCVLDATTDALTVRIDADDEDALRRLQDGIARRLETIGRRDRLTVRWQPSDTALVHTMSAPSPTHLPTPRSRRSVGVLGWAALAVLAILAHVGLLGGALATSAWGSWGTNIILAIVVLKVIAIGAHVVLGRTAVRHRLGRRITRSSPARRP